MSQQMDTEKKLFKRMKKIDFANSNKKYLAMVVPSQVDFKAKTITRDKEGHFC